MYFYQVFQVFGGKSDRFATAKGRQGVREAKRKIVGGTRAKLCQLFASSRRVWKVGHAINYIYCGEILGASRSIRAIDSYILRSDFREKRIKNTYFYQVFKVFGGKKLSFCDSKRSSAVREAKR